MIENAFILICFAGGLAAVFGLGAIIVDGFVKSTERKVK